ncbi:hypothetical protein HHI36_008814 [Cryptolaemus montrouzieri]|uniref:Uncharacterized protein n=1 Tax=Cryptolaemus montrouzieri TaxID=559131 RepID=A0ABD2MTI6_9CUCU
MRKHSRTGNMLKLRSKQPNESYPNERFMENSIGSIKTQTSEKTSGEIANGGIFHTVLGHVMIQYVNVECIGRVLDGGAFKNTSFYKYLDRGILALPEDESLRGRTLPVPYVLVRDDDFGLPTPFTEPYATDIACICVQSFSETNRNQSSTQYYSHCVGLCTSSKLPLITTRFGKLLLTPGCCDNEDNSTGAVIPGARRDHVVSDNAMTPLGPIPRHSLTFTKNAGRIKG